MGDERLREEQKTVTSRWMSVKEFFSVVRALCARRPAVISVMIETDSVGAVE
jgi:hypothetical protein